jgi:tripartite-type tricarboxylate transporter receptor subunit TctC
MKLLQALLATAAMAASFAAAAQAYPSQVIRLICPYAAGGPVEAIAREVAVGLSSELGRQVIVEIRAGGGTVVGANYVAKSAPDGYTLLLGSQATHIIQPAINPDIPYNAEKDFAPVAMYNTVPGLISVPADSPVTNLKDLIAYIKQRPGQINYASSGVSTGSHLGGELFNALAGTKMVHVPYKGAGPATIALLSKEIHVGFMNVTPQLPHIKAQKLRAIAITGSTRTSALPDVPTAAEAGMPGLLAESWTGFFAPAGTPPAAIATFYNALAKVMLKAETKARLASMGADVMLQNPEELAAYVAADRKRLLPILNSLNLKSN